MEKNLRVKGAHCHVDRVERTSSRDTSGKFCGDEKVRVFLRSSASLDSRETKGIYEAGAYIAYGKNGLKDCFGSIAPSSGFHKNSPRPVPHAESGVQQLQCAVVLDIVQHFLIGILLAPEASTPKPSAPM